MNLCLVRLHLNVQLFVQMHIVGVCVFDGCRNWLHLAQLESGGMAQQRTGWRCSNLLLATPASVCKQPGAAQDQATLLPGRAAVEGCHAPGGRWGLSHVAWWREALLGAVPGPPTSSTTV